MVLSQIFNWLNLARKTEQAYAATALDATFLLIATGVEESWSATPQEGGLPVLSDDHQAQRRERSTCDAHPAATIIHCFFAISVHTG
jgi:hypothetical protein